jgi:hypothetical protein
VIGVIVKTEMDAEELSLNWLPDSMSEQAITTAFQETLTYSPNKKEFVHEQGQCLIHFTIDDGKPPRAISFSCSVNQSSAQLLNKLAKMLNAKIYDSESCCFVEL